MPLQHFDLQRIAAMPWRNGAGQTREIACWPPGAGMEDFDWRASVATVSADAAFSAFPGVQRHIALVRGDGFMLHDTASRVAGAVAAGLAPLSFDGAQRLSARLSGGPSEDFNLMVRQGRAEGQLTRHKQSATLTRSRHGVLLVASGLWRARDSEGTMSQELGPDQGLWWADSDLAWQLEAIQPGTVFAAQVHAATVTAGHVAENQK